MSRLVLPAEILSQLRKDLLSVPKESCAILFGRVVRHSETVARVVVRDFLYPTEEDYLSRSGDRAVLRPEFVAEAAQRARREGSSLVFVHTHPFPLNHFSSIDDEGEKALAEFLSYRLPGTQHATLLLTPEQSVARLMNTNISLRVVGCGQTLIWGSLDHENRLDLSRYDRQVRVFGSAGQDIIRSLRVGIVGLGGTGSIVLQALAHLGVNDFLLLDPDQVEASNLNRLVGASPSDVGRPKVQVAQDLARRINPTAQIDARRESVLLERVALGLTNTDFVFCCTDSHGSRAVLNQLAYQYLIPSIDMGVVIATAERRITHVAGRTQLLAPGAACMVCGDLLDPEQVRRDLLTEFERKADPYILGDEEPAPSVISLNSTVASLAVTMFLDVAVGVPGKARLLNYNALTGVCRPAVCEPHPRCVVCSPSGAFARAGEWQLPARQD
jgi:hypothetical protein